MKYPDRLSGPAKAFVAERDVEQPVRPPRPKREVCFNLADGEHLKLAMADVKLLRHQRDAFRAAVNAVMMPRC